FRRVLFRSKPGAVLDRQRLKAARAGCREWRAAHLEESPISGIIPMCRHRGPGELGQVNCDLASAGQIQDGNRSVGGPRGNRAALTLRANTSGQESVVHVWLQLPPVETGHESMQIRHALGAAASKSFAPTDWGWIKTRPVKMPQRVVAKNVTCGSRQHGLVGL